ncbi:MULTISPECIES: hypothetical protein [Rhodanobacter]|uniref:HTH cro/C1-type domain-containing protein n=1 Tax=Rhodanobacter denitrificans TaxID=666685 RepID=I4WM04_9GAMM|nr:MULTISPECIES: hypothetical protein [Rhodanobacter]AGG90253.1 hypothetical protein R2APBS1_3181 [Rhodanobacter denitrificans]EIM00496.1 filamentous phage phiLf related protein [Rhodanobacter denitrificans]KZC18466.1 hypothetical protein RHOFW104R3_36270 [Rhodanobacter denitrificans]UJJ50343.1 hypothetical protein LRK52_14040 [Rhodanobacter denitrificans]UJM85639.1 hypothetical protein LRJ86_12720 [Rhodanobacter denitrificans]
MQATLELFERYKLRIGAHADSAGAAALGVKSQTVSNWRTRGSQAEPWLIEKMCNALGIDTAEWLLRVQMEQAPSASNKLVWRRVGERLGYKVAGIGVVLVSSVTSLEGCFTQSAVVLAEPLMQAVRLFAQLAEGLPG